MDHAVLRLDTEPAPGVAALLLPGLGSTQRQDDSSAMCNLLKLSDLRGDSQFTTWAHRFVMFELASKIRERARRGLRVIAGPTPDVGQLEPRQSDLAQFDVDLVVPDGLPLPLWRCSAVSGLLRHGA